MIKRIEFSKLQCRDVSKKGLFGQYNASVYKTEEEVIKESLDFINTHDIVSITDSYHGHGEYGSPLKTIVIYYKE